MSIDLGCSSIPVADVEHARAFHGGPFGAEFAPDAVRVEGS